MTKKILTLLILIATSITSFSQQPDDYYFGIVKKYQLQFLNEVCSWTSSYAKQNTGTYSWSISDRYSDNTVKKMQCRYLYDYYGNPKIEYFEIVFIGNIPIGYYNGITNCTGRYAIFCNDDVSKLAVGANDIELSYEDFVRMSSITKKDRDELKIDKKKYDKTISLYKKFYENERQNSASYKALMEKYAFYDKNYNSKNSLAIFAKTEKVSQWTWQKNSDFDNGVSVEQYTLRENGNLVERSDFFYRNISNKPVVIKGISINYDGDEVTYQNRSIYLNPNDVIDYIEMRKNLNFNDLNVSSIYFWGDFGEIKKIPTPSSPMRNYHYVLDINAEQFITSPGKAIKETNTNSEVKTNSEINTNKQKEIPVIDFSPKYTVKSFLPKKYVGVLTNTTASVSSSCAIEISITPQNYLRMKGNVDNVNLFGTWDITSDKPMGFNTVKYVFTGVVNLGYPGSPFPKGTTAPISFDVEITKNELKGTTVLTMTYEGTTSTQYGVINMN